MLCVLGHVVGEGGVFIPQARVAAIEAYLKPSTKKGLHSILGTISYYRKFIKDLAGQTAVLTPATSKNSTTESPMVQSNGTGL